MKHQQHGFAMIEVLVTAVILAIGISGMGVLLLKSVQSSQDNSQKSQGMWIVQDLVGRMRSNPEGMRAKAYETSGAFDCAPIKACSVYNNNGFEPSQSCSTSQMASFDNWVSVCGANSTIFNAVSSEFLYDSPSDFIINPILDVSCTNTTSRVSTYTGQADCVQYFIQLTWSTKLQQGAPNEDDRVFQSSFSMVLESN